MIEKSGLDEAYLDLSDEKIQNWQEQTSINQFIYNPHSQHPLFPSEQEQILISTGKLCEVRNNLP